MDQTLLSIANTVGLPNVYAADTDDCMSNCQKLLDDLKQTIQTRLLASEQKWPKPVFQHQLNENEWKTVNDYAEMLNVEFAQRAQLMVKRLEVTFESFLWSDRVKKLEREIMDVYKPAKEAILSPQGVFAEDVLAATTDILRVEKAASKNRQSTSNPIISYLVKQQPKDRGGRTAEMKVPQAEVSSWQQRSHETGQSQGNIRGRGNSERGGVWHGGRGRGDHGGRGRGDHGGRGRGDHGGRGRGDHGGRGRGGRGGWGGSEGQDFRKRRFDNGKS